MIPFGNSKSQKSDLIPPKRIIAPEWERFYINYRVKSLIQAPLILLFESSGDFVHYVGRPGYPLYQRDGVAGGIHAFIKLSH